MPFGLARSQVVVRIEIIERADHEIGPGEVERGGHRTRNGETGEPREFRRGDTVGRILEGDRTTRRDTDLRARFEIHRGIRLAAQLTTGTHHAREMFEQLAGPEMALDPLQR